MKLGRVVLAAAGILIVLSLLFPPWVLPHPDRPSKSQGYGFILSGPSVERLAEYSRPDLERLALQVGAIALSASIILILFGGPRGEGVRARRSAAYGDQGAQITRPRLTAAGRWIGIAAAFAALLGGTVWAIKDDLTFIGNNEGAQPMDFSAFGEPIDAPPASNQAPAVE